MKPLTLGSQEAERINTTLEEWQQGDYALDDQLYFVHVGDSALPLSEAAAEADDSGLQAFTSSAAGLVVLTQTCDVVRSCTERPYVEVAPIVELESSQMRDVARGRRPNYAALQPLTAQNLAVDLDRTMTVEKSVVSQWARNRGCHSDEDSRQFSEALARKRQRFAFPDDFNHLVNKLRQRLIGKHEKCSPEGIALRALREIRVQALPSWNEASVQVHFWFIREAGDSELSSKEWFERLEAWLALASAANRFIDVTGHIATLRDMTAEDYVTSDRLDLDHLSLSK